MNILFNLCFSALILACTSLAAAPQVCNCSPCLCTLESHCGCKETTKDTYTNDACKCGKKDCGCGPNCKCK